MNRTDLIDVKVQFNNGCIFFQVFWWQNDETIIRDAIKHLGKIAPKPEDCVVYREPERYWNGYEYRKGIEGDCSTCP